MKKKILIISRFIPYTGGREVLLQSLLHYLSSHYDVYLLTPDIGYYTTDFTVYNFTTKAQMHDYIKKINPDIINIHTFYFAHDALELSSKLNIPLILTLHGLFIKDYDKKYYNNLMKITKQSTLVTVVCDLHRKHLIKSGIPKDKICLIRNGISTKKFELKYFNKITARKILNLPLNKKIILVSARFTPIKGLDYLVLALPKIKNNNFKLLISTPAGRYNPEEIEYRNKLIEKAKKLGVEDKIIIQFHENNMMSFLYKACDIFILPSIMEGTPLSLLEAMASKIICIATNVGGIKEILNNKNGYLIPPKNIKKISEAIDKAILSKETIKRRKAYYEVKNNFRDDEMFLGYDKIYKKILNYK